MYILASVCNFLSPLHECTYMGTELVNSMEEFMVRVGQYTHEPQNTGSILHLEQTILELFSNSKVTQGLFYMLPLYCDKKTVHQVTQIKCLTLPHPSLFLPFFNQYQAIKCAAGMLLMSNSYGQNHIYPTTPHASY